MPPAPQLRILLAGEPAAGSAAPLEAAGYAVARVGLNGIDPAEVARANAVVLGVTGKVIGTAQALCRRWRIELGEQFVPFVWLAAADVPPAAGLDAGADVVLPEGVAPDHLVAQLKALLRVHHLHGRLAGRAAEAQHLNQRLQQAFQQIDSDLELTRRIHRGFLPRALPDINRVRFGLCYRPRSRMGGDFYDVLRLDEDHVGIYLADAMGRGLPASSLLSIFVKRSLTPKEILGQSYRLVPPGEVLDRLNREVLNLGLPEPPFVTMVYVQLNTRDGSLTFGRAAHPHPLHIPAVGPVVYWHGAGTLLGVFDAEYPVQQRQFAVGDKMVLFSDGVHPPSAGPGGVHDPLVEAVERHRRLAVQPFVDAVARDLLETSRQPDDFTLLAVELT
jgi:sigma-B regulation protein RsbU (phosphoserine phosphatase)